MSNDKNIAPESTNTDSVTYESFNIESITTPNFDNENLTDENHNNVSIIDENTVARLFIKYAQPDSNGDYSFTKYSELNNVSFFYNFIYRPSDKLYNCNVLVITHTNIKLYDYASVTFSWGNFKNGSFYACHELDSIAKIEFRYSNMDFSNKTIGDTYSYALISNSFVNLKNPVEIDAYAAQSFDWIQQAISFINLVFANYHILTDLW